MQNSKQNLINDDLEVAEMIEEESLLSIEELKSKPLENSNKERFLIVSNYSRFASVDVWAGIIGAFREMGYFALAYAVHDLRALLAADQMLHNIVSMAVSVKNGFTHVIFVGSAFIPSWVIKSIQRCGVKVIYWLLEDPHALDQNSKFYNLADYYFSNERMTKTVLHNSFYMPTAGDHRACMPPKEDINSLPKEDKDILKNDIVFCGNVYPNRQEVLEKIVPLCDKKGYKFSIIGITHFMKDKDKSPLKKHIIGEFTGIIDHRWLIMM